MSIRIVCPACDTTNRVPPERDARAATCGRCKSALFEAAPLALTTARFRKHLASSDLPLIADFWAAWCGPCRAYAPAFAQAAKALEPLARFVKIDVDAEPELAAEFEIRSIPSLLLFKDGKVSARHAGGADLRFLKHWIDQTSPYGSAAAV